MRCFVFFASIACAACAPSPPDAPDFVATSAPPHAAPPAAASDQTTPATTSTAPPPAEAKHLDWRARANETRAFVTATLATPAGSFRTSADEDRTDEWHDVSQLGADAAMLGLGDAKYDALVTSSAAFLDKLWDHGSTAGGYYPTSAADGTGVATDVKYVDDNSLAGVTWLDTWEVTKDPAQLAAARAVANFLMNGGVWDDTYGGGYWWSTYHPDKPTQSNGLALQLFARLAAIGGETYYRDWATSIETWLEQKMFDDDAGLYSWQWDTSGRNDLKFTYDQAVLIDAHLALRALTKDDAHLARAQAIAEAMHRVLWDQASGGYVISTSDRRLSPVYSGWASCTLIRLFEADGNKKWLDRAEQNANAIDARLRDGTTHGYYASSNPDGSDRVAFVQEVDQAWMQRVSAMLAKHL